MQTLLQINETRPLSMFSTRESALKQATKIEQARSNPKFAQKNPFAKLLKGMLRFKMEVDLKFMIEFINPVAASINELVEDEELNEENLKDITS